MNNKWIKIKYENEASIYTKRVELELVSFLRNFFMMFNVI